MPNFEINTRSIIFGVIVCYMLYDIGNDIITAKGKLIESEREVMTWIWRLSGLCKLPDIKLQNLVQATLHDNN